MRAFAMAVVLCLALPPAALAASHSASAVKGKPVTVYTVKPKPGTVKPTKPKKVVKAGTPALRQKPVQPLKSKHPKAELAKMKPKLEKPHKRKSRLHG